MNKLNLLFCLFKSEVMQQNWYIIYTKPGAEKKVATSLARKNIEHFLPLCNKWTNNLSIRRPVKEPLFTGYVFVFVATSQLIKVQQEVGALSVVYWKAKPATLTSEDIEAIKDFTSRHDSIRLISTKVNINKKSNMADPPPLVVNETLVTQQNYFLKLSVPSMGFVLVSERENEIDINTIISHQRETKILN